MRSLTILGIIFLLVGGGIILTFVLPSSVYWLAPSAEDAWKYVETKGIKIVDHSEIFKKFNVTDYKGSSTCIKCHEREVKDFVHSIHYKMWNFANDVEGRGKVAIGSRIMYNDFCGAIFWNKTASVNFIGMAILKKVPSGFEKLKGRLIATGCSMCHGVSLGKVPSIDPSDEDLKNVDCLACHSPSYKAGAMGISKGYRKIVKTKEGFRYIPNISIEEASKIAAKPPKDSCLACHAFSGGGPHFKRPNLSPDLFGSPSESFDVHMARGLHCSDCHAFEDHKVATKAVDTDAREGKAVTCESCHKKRHRAPIIGFFIETFHKEVACQTCHIPTIAHGKYPTDVERDWRHIEFNAKMKRWEPKIKLEKNIVPKYMWWDGKRELYIYPERPSNDFVVYAKPVVNEHKKLYPFKVHVAYIPIDEEKGIPIPVKVGIVFSIGNRDLAIKKGAEIAGLHYTGKFTKMIRYMNVDHGVVPAKDALKCTDCHSPWTRLPLEELGFGATPKIAYYGAPLLALLGIALIAYDVMRPKRS
jgi:hypothetical protein